MRSRREETSLPDRNPTDGRKRPVTVGAKAKPSKTAKKAVADASRLIDQRIAELGDWRGGTGVGRVN
jgi:hypothetical protein